MKAFERLIRYAQIHTSSDDKSGTTPSSDRQRDLSLVLRDEMTALDFDGVYVDEHAYVYGFLPATAGREGEPCIALIAHLDTIPDSDFSGKDVRPRLVENYDGGELPLGESGRVLSPSLFPDLENLKGHTLITTDGTTILGADDKAGIAEILTACEELLRSGLPHGRVAVCFTPDEEIGHGASLLSFERLGADFGYTVDGGGLDQINTETFNAAEVTVTLTGVNVHPGDAKGRMRNASLLAVEFAGLLPAAERPETTQGYEGFFHLTDMSGTVDRASLSYIVRDHDAVHFEIRKNMMAQAAVYLNEKYGQGTASLTVRDQYRNMAEVLQRCPQAISRAEDAIRKAGLTPHRVPVRGGTDGSQLSFRGLPCPNLGTGGACFHGPYEHISVQNMDLAVRILINLLTA